MFLCWIILVIYEINENVSGRNGIFTKYNYFLVIISHKTGFYYQVLKKTSDIEGAGSNVIPSNTPYESLDKKAEEGWRAIKIDDYGVRNHPEDLTVGNKERPNQNRRRKIRRKTIKRKIKRRRKKPKRKRRNKKKRCRKWVKTQGRRVCVTRPCTVAWCKSRRFRSLNRIAPHKYNFWGYEVNPI